MARTLLLLALVVFAAGCGTTAPPPPAAAKAGRLPPEVEHDPATATQMYQDAAKKKAARR